MTAGPACGVRGGIVRVVAVDGGRKPAPRALMGLECRWGSGAGALVAGVRGTRVGYEVGGPGPSPKAGTASFGKRLRAAAPSLAG